MAQDVGEWQKKIVDTFSDPSGMVGPRLAELMRHEQHLSERYVHKFAGYVRIMDAFFDFYIQTFQLACQRAKDQWSENLPLLTALHVGNLWRFRASYMVFWNGYYVEGQSLLRAVYENALHLCTFHKGLITVNELSGLEIGGGQAGAPADKEELYRRMNERSRETEAKVRKAIVGESSGLDAKTIEDLTILLRVLHIAVHKSKMNLVLHYSEWVQGEKPLPIYPEYSEEWPSGYMNVSQFMAWTVVRSLPYLQATRAEFGEEWKHRYEVLDEGFAVANEGLRELGKSLGNSIAAFMAKHFGDSAAML